MLVKPIPPSIHLLDVQLDTEFDMIDGLDEVIIESCKPALTMPRVELIQILQYREVGAWRRADDKHGLLLLNLPHCPVSVCLHLEIPPRELVDARPCTQSNFDPLHHHSG